MLKILPSYTPTSLSKQTKLQRVASSIGAHIPDSFSHIFEMNKMGALDRIPLFILSLIFVLGMRFIKSRDNNERREVFTRDTSSIVATMLAVPVIKNWMERGVSKVSKIPIAAGNKMFMLDVLNLDNLKNWYSKAEFMPEKALSLAKNIVEKKGDVKTAFATLGDEASKHITTMLNGAENTSENIVKSLEKAMKSNDKTMKNAFEGLTKILSTEDNGLVKAAQRLKAIPAIASLAFVTLLLGWGIPAMNIRITRKKLKGAQSANMKPAVLEPQINDSQQKIISSFFAKV